MAKKIKQAVILAGGQGTRLRPFTLTAPKPMVPIAGKPFLEHLVEFLRTNNIEEIIMLLGYLPDKIIDYFGDGKNFGVTIRYSITPVEDETGTRIKKAEWLFDENFLLMYCDNYLPFQLERLVRLYREKGTLAAVTIYSNKDKITKNNVFVDAEGYVTKYDKSRLDPDLNGVDVGFFILNKNVLADAPDADFSFERVIIPQLVEKRQLVGYVTDQRYYSMGSSDRLPVTEDFFRSKKVILLDRDGVINRRPPKADYVKIWDEFEFLPGAIDGLQLLSRKGYEIYLITNQPGIARGVMRLEDLETIHANLKKELEKKHVNINEIYMCLHNWDDGCDCRKPKPGLFFRAANEHHFDLTKATMIGDDERDIEAGNAAGCKTILMKSDGSLFDVVKSIL